MKKIIRNYTREKQVRLANIKEAFSKSEQKKMQLENIQKIEKDLLENPETEFEIFNLHTETRKFLYEM